MMEAARFEHRFGSRDNKLNYSYVNVKNVIACKSFQPISLLISETMVTPTNAKCAACGKDGDGLKKCTACGLVKYCGVDCQRAHRPQHKNACKRRAAELHDAALFRQPPSREECPICFQELPIMAKLQKYKACCGKILCCGCWIASAEQSDNEPCPFCREPNPSTDEEERKRMERRMELKDAEAIGLMGITYLTGGMGFEQDIGKALALLRNAVELGSMNAHYNLGCVYYLGKNGVEVDSQKAMYHYEIAAMAGCVGARYNLSLVEADIGNLHRAMKHLIISASAGHEQSLKGVQSGYRDGMVTKDDFEKTLRAHQKSKDEMKSEWRDHAAAKLSTI